MDIVIWHRVVWYIDTDDREERSASILKEGCTLMVQELSSYFSLADSMLSRN
jgi:hypothetical protein